MTNITNITYEQFLQGECNMTNITNITYEQFCFWLRGYLAGTKRPKVDVVSKELARVAPCKTDWLINTTLPGTYPPVTTNPLYPNQPVKYRNPIPGVQEIRIGDSPDFEKTKIYCEASQP